ncbi:agamous-like MADS-box protein AGL27 isoform X1 [Bidens hawaiensis]|uniref:agamous-like MADS-box protein AGL27 isoform X1 n=1 Tax=Bidens hawaiensis TaxID=980011 RepID=UPI00404B592F
MGRRKLEMKRIEDKSSRLVTFSKRRSGLVNKARQLSVLCDVDVAVIVFSARGKLYEYSSTNSVGCILSRYQKRCPEAGEVTNGAGEDLCKGFQTCKELLQKVDSLVHRLDTEDNAEKLSVNDMIQLEQDLDAALMQTRFRKTQLMMKYISTLKEKENMLNGEKEELEKQVAAAAENDVDDGGGDLNDLAANHINSPQLVTLSLFNG